MPKELGRRGDAQTSRIPPTVDLSSASALTVQTLREALVLQLAFEEKNAAKSSSRRAQADRNTNARSAVTKPQNTDAEQ